MNIFDAHISGSLSVSASAEFSGNITVLGIVSGSFQGDGTNITNIPASGVTGLNLTQIADGSSTASISQTNGFRINNNTEITGTLKVTGNIDGAADFNSLRNLPTLVSSSSQLTSSYDTRYVLSGSITQTTWDNIASKPDGIVSGSVQVNITDTTGYSTFSSSIANINSNQDSRLNSIETASGSIRNDFNTYTGSNDSTNTTQNSRLTSIETATGSLNTFTSSANNRIGAIETESSSIRTNFNSYTSSNDETNTTQNSRLSSIETSTGSLNSFSSSANNRLNSIESSTGSINTFTSSINTTIKNKLNTEGVISGSIQIDITNTNGYSTFSSSISTSLGNLSSSFNSTNDTQNSKLNSIESTTSSLNTFSSSINTTIKSKLNTETVISGSDQVVIGDTTGYSTFSSSISTSIGNISSSIATTTSGLSSEITSLSSSLTSSISTVSSSINTSIGSLSSSVATTTNNLSTSIASVNLSQDNRLSTIEGRYATTGSNQFNGSQTITGSLVITQNLTVLGSSSIVYTTSSQLMVEDNVITVNASSPAERFAGLQVYDSGSNGSITASLFWDGQNNRWIYQNSSEAHYGGAMFIAGPRNTGSLGDEITLTNGRIPKSIGGDHIGDSIISEFSGSIAISGSLIVTGSILSVGTSLVSGSSQIDHNATTNYDSNKHIDHTAVSITAGAGLTGGGDISSTRTINVGAGNGITVNADDIAIDTSSATFTTGVKSKLNSDTVHSGSYLGTATTANLSENTNLYYTDARVKTKLNAEGVISGSAQVTGLSNSQLTNSSITIAGTSTSLGGSISAATIGNAIGAFSGSAQVSGLSNSQLTNSSITIGSTSTSLGGTSTSLAGLTSVTSTAFTGSIQGYATSETLATVTGRGASTTNKLTVTASGTGGSPLLSLSVSNASSFVHGQETFAPNLTSTQAVINPIGVAGSTKNAAYIGYKYSGTGGSNDNLLTFGHWGADHLMTMNGAGNVSITGTVTASNLSGTNTGDQTNITGNAGTVTNGVYTNTNQTITGEKTFQQQGDGISIYLDSTNVTHATRFRFRKNGTDYWSLDARGSGESDALNLYRYYSGTWYQTVSWNHSNSNATFAGAISASNLSGTNTGDETTARINALAITSVGTITSGTWNGSSISTTYTAAKVTAVNAGTGVGVDTTTGSVTVSIGQAVATSSSPTFAGLTLSGPLSITGNGSYLGDWGYNTIVLQDTSGYTGIAYKSGNNVWLNRRNGGDASFEWAYSTNASAQGTGTYTQQGKFTTGGDLYIRGLVYVGNGGSAGTILSRRYSTSFSSVTSVTVTHNLGTKDVAVFVYDGSDNMFWPSSIVTTSTSVVTITFASSRSGRVVVVG